MEVEFSHALKNAMGLFSIGLGVWRGDEKVIHIDDKPSFSDHVSEQVIHELLEYGGGVAEAKEHDCQLKESFVSDEGSFPLVTVFDTNVIVTPSNIELGEMLSVFQLVHKVGDEGERVSITSGVLIEVAVVLARMEFAILLLDKEEGGGLGRVGRSYLPCS